ncbi:MAG TPA: translation elongation factor Ts [Bacteroidia bacterium]
MESKMAISASEVNKLRQQTGAGMMDCKKALEEANGDFEQAIDFLRKKGQKVAANRQDRDAKEGLVIARVSADAKHGSLVVVNCETDFVAINADFVAFANTISQISIDKNPASIEAFNSLPYNNNISVSDKFIEQIGKIGEKIQLSYYQTVSVANVVAYNHPGNKLACVVGFTKSVSEEVAKNIAMQVAAMGAVAVDKADVDTKTLERELDIAREQARAEGKAEDMIEKIAQGKLNKFYKESTLLNQEFIKDNKKTIRQYLQEIDKDLSVTDFKRYQLS